ncbi:unnamed protein product, partial [Trichogramma brassicae]
SFFLLKLYRKYLIESERYRSYIKIIPRKVFRFTRSRRKKKRYRYTCDRVRQLPRLTCDEKSRKTKSERVCVSCASSSSVNFVALARACYIVEPRVFAEVDDYEDNDDDDYDKDIRLKREKVCVWYIQGAWSFLFIVHTHIHIYSSIELQRQPRRHASHIHTQSRSSELATISQ